MDSGFGDQTLTCRDCGTQFIWSAGEQAFYASKNLMNSPSRCPACRAQARASRESGGRLARANRELFPVVCSRCGVQTQVPFLPRDDRPVYCSSCFDLVRVSGEPLRSAGG
jgi:CxxC-x17-CxxC domain-containing protein